MSEQGNVREKGAARVVGATGAFVVDAQGRSSNNGMFASVNRAAQGHYEYTVDPEWSMAPSDVVTVVVEELNAGTDTAVDYISETRFDVWTFDRDEPEFVDLDHGLVVTEINKQ